MKSHHATTLRIIVTSAIAVALGLMWSARVSPRAAAGVPQIPQELRERAERDGRVRVIVEIDLAANRFVPEASLRDATAVIAQRRTINAGVERVLAKLSSGRRVRHRYQTLPYVALELTPDALAALDNSPDGIVRVMDDAIVRPVLSDSVPLIEGDQAWDAGYDGTGTMIAVVDSGVDSTHPFLAGRYQKKRASRATWRASPPRSARTTSRSSSAPARLRRARSPTASTAPTSPASPPATALPRDKHFPVSPGASLIAVQVFSKITNPLSCGGAAPCAGAFTSDIIAALEYVYASAATHDIASVNMSLGGEIFTPPCDDQPYKPIIDNLRAIGIASVVASGNGASGSQLSTPACVSSAISVGSTTKTDEVSWFSNVATSLSLFAPGEAITSSVPGGLFTALSGTSMAAPHVAGTWAVMKQAVPGASVSTILQSLQQKGLPIQDTRIWGGSAIVPRVRILRALATLVTVVNPSPAATALSPEHVRAGSATMSIQISGSGFNTFSVARWNGVARPTTVLSRVKLLASIPASDLVSDGTAQVSVSTPAPGGGSSSSLTFTIDPGPSIAVNATAVGPGSQVTATLSDGIGDNGDWLALSAVGASDTSYLQWIYVGAGVTTRTWTVNMPATAGTYEFRLFVNNTRTASSPPVVVDPAIASGPTLSSLTPGGAAMGGAAFTLTASGSHFVAASVVRWNGADRPTTFVSSTQLSASIPARDIAASGTAQVTVFTPEPGGGTSAALPFTIGGTPTLSVSATIAATGTPVTVTLTNGFGGSADWLALAATSAPNGNYLNWTYVGSGVTTRTWTVNMPTTAGTYEFRLFLNNGSTRAATSPAVTVSAGPSPVPGLTSLTPNSAPTGGAGFTLVATGSGFATSSVIRWNGADRPTTFVNSTQLSATIPATDLALGGTAQVAVFSPAPGGGTSNALPFTIGGSPTLAVSATTANPGAQVTVTLTNGFGGASDWLALAASSAPNGNYLLWTYVGGGVNTRTWTVNMPTTAGTYEFRLFLNNGSTRAATSPPVTIAAGPSPAPVLSGLNPASAPTGGAAFTLVATGSGFATSSVIRWNGTDRPTTFVSATQLSAAIPATDLAVAGTAQVTVFSPAPGGGTSAALPFTIGGSPTLAVSATTANPGAQVTVTLTNGFGGATDWLALAESSASNGNYSKWTYVGAGVTTRTWTVNMPTTAGTYEFRLFLNNGSTRAATSPTVTVTP